MTQTLYATPQDVWDWLNGYTVIRQELITSSATSSVRVFNLSQSSLVSGSVEVAYNSGGATEQKFLEATQLSSGAFSVDYDNGVLTISTGSMTTIGTSSVWANYRTAPINDSIVQKLLSSSSREVERVTGRNFDYVTGSVETFNVDGERDFFTQYFPIISISTLRTNDSDAASSPTYTTLSAGLGADYLLTDYDKGIGRFRIIDNAPLDGAERLEVTYDHGYTDSNSRPLEVQRLTILRTIREMLINPALAKSIIAGQEKLLGLSTSLLDSEIQTLQTELKKVFMLRV